MFDKFPIIEEMTLSNMFDKPTVIHKVHADALFIYQNIIKEDQSLGDYGPELLGGLAVFPGCTSRAAANPLEELELRNPRFLGGFVRRITALRVFLFQCVEYVFFLDFRARVQHRREHDDK